jgi:hypothetical protein
LLLAPHDGHGIFAGSFAGGLNWNSFSHFQHLIRIAVSQFASLYAEAVDF